MFALENVGFLQKEVGGDDGDDEDDNFIEDDDEANAGFIIGGGVSSMDFARMDDALDLDAFTGDLKRNDPRFVSRRLPLPPPRSRLHTRPLLPSLSSSLLSSSSPATLPPAASAAASDFLFFRSVRFLGALWSFLISVPL